MKRGGREFRNHYSASHALTGYEAQERQREHKQCNSEGYVRKKFLPSKTTFVHDSE